jgi:hypothetical protein
MEFLKKNWSKLVLAAISLVGAVLMLLPVFTTPASELTFIGASQIIGLILFFLGILTYFILKMFDKTKLASKFTLLSTGLLATIFLFVGLFGFTAKHYTKEDYKDMTSEKRLALTVVSQVDPLLAATKGQGALGKTYGFFKGLEEHAKESKTDLETLQAGVAKFATTAGLTNESSVAVLNAAIAATKTQIQTLEAGIAGLEALETLSEPQQAQLATLKGQYAAAGTTSEKLGDLQSGIYQMSTLYTVKNSTATEMKTLTTVGELKAMNDEIIKLANDNIKAAKTGANTALYTYVSLLLTLGLFPIVLGAKKLVCHYVRKDECCK